MVSFFIYFNNMLNSLNVAF